MIKFPRVYIDATLSMVKHTDHISRSAHLEMRRISSVRHLLTTKATAQLMSSFVLSRLDRHQPVGRLDSDFLHVL